MTFEEWADWKQKQNRPTCDFMFCLNIAVWKLPRNSIYFCAKHGEKRLDYGETPVFIGGKGESHD
jgi:hypothetical protein